MTEPLLKPNISRFHQLLEQQGLDLDAIYGPLSLDKRHMVAKDSGIAMAKYMALLEEAALASKRRFLMAEVAIGDSHDNLGMLAYILKNAKDLKAALELLGRYISLVSPGASCRYKVHKGQVELEYQAGPFQAVHCRQDVEGTLVQLVLLIRTAINDSDWLPNKIHCVHPLKDKEFGASQSDQVFPLACPLQFQSNSNSVVFDVDLLDYSNQNYDPQLLALLEQQLQKSGEHLPHSDELLDKIRLFISANLHRQDLNINELAAHLGLSRSTLQRRLKALGLRFQQLRDDIVLQIAKQSLSTTNTPITELALQLGYSEASAFNRAFKRLTSYTPRQYRQQSQQC